MNRPFISEAYGIRWTKLKGGQWRAAWRARTDLVKRGWEPAFVSLWMGTELTETVADMIRDRCQDLQRRMLVWGRNGTPQVKTFDGTLSSLIGCYRTDPDSPYQKLRSVTKISYDGHLNGLINEHGGELIGDIKPRQVMRWHEAWKGGQDGTQVTKAHSRIAHLRMVMRFGATLLEDPECLRVSGLLTQMRFPGIKTRRQTITAEQVMAIRAEAHRVGLHSIALAQALQFEGTLRQKDVLGEWVKMDAREGISDVKDGNEKWLRGIRGSEIDKDMILRHVTSKRQKEVTIDLKLAPMTMEELQRLGTIPGGPLIICEFTGMPWRAVSFRQRWRRIARAVGVPDAVFNMDSRSGAITEAVLAGAKLEQIRHAATHSQLSQTADYDRGQAEATANVMRLRVAHRMNKTGTNGGENV